MSQKKRWDIFCKIVDNFGDIGVCWRLAKQLTHEHGLQVRLLIDDLGAAKKIISSFDLDKKTQLINNITIQHWQIDTVFDDVAEVVIEAFACSLPSAYLTRMTASTVWVNLEYLSAEPWVADFHAKHAKQGNLTRHFYFPGFNENTGGLLREHDLVKQRDAFSQGIERDDEMLKISLFCYETAPLQALFHKLSRGIKKTTVFAPLHDSITQVAPFFGKKSFNAGDVLTQGQLTLQVLPFLSQTDYDQLLWSCDINFVRGEDSWVRAIWADKPFIWQPYVQSENTHIAKLNAFLETFYYNSDIKQVVAKAHLDWSTGHVNDDNWQQYLNSLQAIKTYTLKQSKQLAEQSDLTAKLVIFCNA